MTLIHVLDEPTINQIAAGEVVERPSAVVKELVENALDAKATAITVEIKEGGLSFIRITDNGAGIGKEDIPLAFLRHATSKIRSAEDLLSVTSLGFRGEALSSIAAVAQVELITKTQSSLNGYRYLIEGGEEKAFEEIGSPNGTTIIVRNIFFNTPARRKFLKTATTEAGYISDLMERIMISHPQVSFKFIVNNQVKLQSNGNNNNKDILYQIYGRDITKELLAVEYQAEDVKISGYIGKPIITRGNRNFENYFINGRYIKSPVITRAIEEAYRPYLMQHKYPFTSLYLEITPGLIDVNVHPQKLEIRLKNGETVYQAILTSIRQALAQKEMIPKVILTKEEEKPAQRVKLPEPFEENRRKTIANSVPNNNHRMNPEASLRFLSQLSEALSNGPTGESKESDSDSNLNQDISYNNSTNVEYLNEIEKDYSINIESSVSRASSNNSIVMESPTEDISVNAAASNSIHEKEEEVTSLGQLSLFEQQQNEDTHFLSKSAQAEHRIIGQVFSTYWLVEYRKELFIIDQHAAHEKVLYEQIMAAARDKVCESQLLLPPIVLSLTLREQELLLKYEEVLNQLGYEFEHFGGNEYSFRGVPANLYGLSEKELLLDFIDSLNEEIPSSSPNSILVLEKVASMSCKAAVKANHVFSYDEAKALITQLLTLENPYHCPHGRPVIISMSQLELEKKFKRVL